jgi:CHAD domain-containing protein
MPSLANAQSASATTGEFQVPAGPTLQVGRQRQLARTLLKRKTNELFRHLPSALTGDEEAIHQLRVASRRLRAAIPLLVEKPQGRRATRVRKLLQLLTRTAGSSRDLDVMLTTLDHQLKTSAARTTEEGLLRRRLASARRRGKAKMVSSLLDLKISSLRNDLAVLIARGGPPATVTYERFSALVERDGQALYEGFLAVGARLDAKLLHGLRRQARRVRYAVEVFDQVRHYESKASAPWKELQELIGALHDHHVLAEWLEKQGQSDQKRGNADLAAEAMAQADRARTSMHQCHGQFVAAAPVILVIQGLTALGFRSPAKPV